jgi:hypothetical protein
MFIQHGQFGTSFDQERALRVFNGSLSWRKRHNVYGNDNLFIYEKKNFIIDISTNDFPAEYFDRHAIFFKNHDKYNNPIRKEYIFI